MDIIEITPDTIDLDNLDMPDLNIEEEEESCLTDCLTMLCREVDI